jgi:hypothetical protein
MKNEIDWSDAPPTKAKTQAADLRRCPPGGLPPVIVLSDWIVGNEMHWFNGRSFPHLKNDCPACLAKRSKVWKGYLACLDPKTRKVFILEITPNCIDPAAAYKECYGSLRGSGCKLDRSATKINGRVTASFCAANLGGLELPTCPDVRAILQHMWQTDHRKEDSNPQDPRAVSEAPSSNEDLKRKRPDRTATTNEPTTNGTTQQTKRTTPKTNGNKTHATAITETLERDPKDEVQISLKKAGEMVGNRFAAANNFPPRNHN